MLLSAVSFLVVAQSSSKAPEELMNNPVFTGDSVNCEFSYKNAFKILYITFHYGSDQLTCIQGTYTQYIVTLTADTMIFIRNGRIKSVQIQYKRKVGRLQVSSLADNLITDLMKRERQIL
jgi:hypothetical protein